MQYIIAVASRARDPKPNYIFIDNTFVINTVEDKWNANSNLTLISQAKTLLEQARRLSPTTLIWVPGHAGIFGNELADFLAKRGASGISSTSFPSEDELEDIRTATP